MSDRDERFDERELARILETGSRGRPRLPAPRSAAGFTVREIESIAREAGIDPGRIAAAAASVALDRVPGRFGGPARISLRREIEGVLDADDLGAVADAIDDAIGMPGARVRSADGLEWSTGREGSGLRVSVRPGPESTGVRLHRDDSAVKGLCYLASMAGALALGGITGAVTEPASVLAGIGIMVGAASAGAAAGWAVWRTRARRVRDRAVRAFVAATARTFELAAPGASAPGSAEGKEPA